MNECCLFCVKKKIVENIHSTNLNLNYSFKIEFRKTLEHESIQ